MRIHIFILVSCLIMALLSCEKKCDEDGKVALVLVDGGSEIMNLEGEKCDLQQQILSQKIDNYIVRTYFNNYPASIEGYRTSGDLLYDNFEAGTEVSGKVINIIPTNLSSNYVEVIRLSDLAHNLSNPVILGHNERSSDIFEGQMELNGNPLQLMLTFKSKEGIENNTDVGGAKFWVFEKIEKWDGSEYTEEELNDFECIDDNSIIYMKGRRFKYVPNQLCEKEQQEITANAPQLLSETAWYGSYKVEVAPEGYDDLGTKYLIILDMQVRQETVRVLEADWNQIVIIVEREINGQPEYSRGYLVPNPANPYPKSL